MECLRAAEVLSAAHDGEVVDPDDLTRATAHCHDCPSCARFVETMSRIDHVLAVPAPAALVERIESRIHEVAADVAPAHETAPDHAPVDLAAHRRSTRPAWSGRLVAFASVAAVLMVALGVSSVALMRGLGGGRETAVTADGGSAMQLTATPEAAEADGYDVRAVPAPAGPAPAYIVVGGGVWALTGPATVDTSRLTVFASFDHSLEDTGTPERHDALRTAGDTATIYVRTPDGYLSFERVVRSFGRKRYGLVSGAPITRFGEWPTLPAQFSPPRSDDGAPTFRAVAKDDLNVDVFIPNAGDISRGFAVAPGTDPGDPAAGNPGWTWWEPVSD